MKTHRCEKSLKSKVSIRYNKQFPRWNIGGDKEAWRLYHYTYNGEYDSITDCHVSEIEFCPYCGEKLP
jgi:hypothetical protein